MSRQAQIFILTHFYPLFIAILLYREKWDRCALVLMYTVPAFIVLRILWLWVSSSHIKLNSNEILYLKYFILSILFYNLYCLLSIFVNIAWVKDHNVQAAGFLLITLLFYTYKQREYIRIF